VTADRNPNPAYLNSAFLSRGFFYPGVLSCALGLAACGQSDSEPGESESAEPARTSAAAPHANLCLATFADRPCDLLSVALVQRHVDSLPADAEAEDMAAVLKERGISPPSYGGVVYNGCSYSWDGGRKTAPKPAADPDAAGTDTNPYASALDGLKYNRPIEDTVVFKSIQLLETDDPLALFERKWQAPTDAQREALAEQMEQKMEEAREEGRLSETGAATGSNLGRAMASAAIDFQVVEGVGSAARWGGVGAHRSLMVLDGATEFEVAVDVSNDDAVNRNAAIGIARDLLAAAQADCQ
jgi:hypothetical protein